MQSSQPQSTAPAGRRDLLRAAGLALASALPVARALAQPRELVVANWGGDWNERTMRFLETPFADRHGLRIVRSLTLEPERKARLLAERALPRGSIDVAHFSAADAYELNAQDVLEPLDLSRIPNHVHLRGKLGTPYFLPWVFGAVTLAYNPKYLAQPPTAFADLFDPRYAGRLGVLDQSFYNWIYIATLAAGGRLDKVEPGLARLAEIKRSMKPRLYPTHQQLAAAFASEEIWISANYSARIAQWSRDGVPVRSAYPKEGAVTIVFGATIPRRARNKELAYAYLDAMLDPRSLGAYAAASMYAPATGNAQLPAELRAEIDFSAAQQAAMNNPDYGYQARQLTHWQEWWNKEFKG